MRPVVVSELVLFPVNVEWFSKTEEIVEVLTKTRIQVAAPFRFTVKRELFTIRIEGFSAQYANTEMLIPGWREVKLMERLFTIMFPL